MSIKNKIISYFVYLDPSGGVKVPKLFRSKITAYSSVSIEEFRKKFPGNGYVLHVVFDIGSGKIYALNYHDIPESLRKSNVR